MKCEDMLELISGRIDGENTPEEDQRLQAHLDTCEDCGNILQAYLEANHGIAPMEEPSADFTAKVMAAIGKEKAQKKKMATIMPLLATAAALVLVIGMGAVRPMFVQENTAPMAARSMATNTVAFAQPTDAQTIAIERQSNVVVLHEMLSELENCPSEMLADGSLLYELPALETAKELSLAYGLELYTVEDAVESYALLVS